MHMLLSVVYYDDDDFFYLSCQEKDRICYTIWQIQQKITILFINNMWHVSICELSDEFFISFFILLIYAV